MRAPLVAGIVAAGCAALAVPTAAVAAPISQTPAPGPSGPAPTGALTAQDRTFLTEAAQGARFEVAGGRLAADRGADQRIRAFGERMVRDHSREYQELQNLDRRLGVAPPAGVAPEQQKILAIWSGVRGGPFDCSYAPVMFADHQSDVTAFMMAAGHTGNPAVRAFAQSQLPMLRQHLQLADRNLSGLNCAAPPRTPSATSS
ncbi:DUF4142 domain-containing protein [Planosporangium sp. 12N6]|uniref:DUF4142 domain-containing protein n=1 Tax=Planosporangium spinosum TaxID=3402278 RepID=UPI003CF56838